MLTLPEIVGMKAAKIKAYLDGKCPRQFWYAQCPAERSWEEHLQNLHELGFDNYPTAQIAAINALQPHLFFFERILGAEVKSANGYAGDFFHSWCSPLIRDLSDIPNLIVDSDASPVWQTYELAVRSYLHETPADEQLPISFPGLSPLDTACNLCGAEQFFVMLYEEPKSAEYLLDAILTMMVEAYQRVKSLGAVVVSYYGFPGVYCNDLQLPCLSPAHVAHFMTERYARIATECDGLLMALLTNDAEVLRSMLGVDGVTGCAFDKRLPLRVIKENLGHKLFLVPNYCCNDALDKPTLLDGIWWNPIVQSYSRELIEVYREFHEQHSLLIYIERPTLTEICAVRDSLRSDTSSTPNRL